nr:uncharacterized protein LOC109417556 [Aedes albopictus]
MPDKKVEKKLVDLGIVRKALLMTCNSVEQFVTNFDADRDSCQIPVRLENLDRVYRDFLKVQGEIEKHDTAERLEEHLSERVVFEGRYCAAKGFLLSNRAVDLNQTVLNATRVRILKSVASDISQRSQPVLAKVAGVVPLPKRQFPSKFAANVVASDAKPNAPSCFACSDRHFMFQCQSFAKMPVSQRRDLVSQRKLCWNCFRTGHQARSCTSKFSCRSCRDRHHTLLHDPSQPGKSSSAPAVTSKSHEALSVPSTSAPGPASTSQQVSMSVQSQASTVLLQTVALHVVDVHGKSFEARALLDSGSMSNFISSDLANLLAIPQSEADVSVAGIGQSHCKLKRAVSATVRSRIGSFSTQLRFLVIDHPTTNLPTIHVKLSSWKLPKVELADPQFHVPNKIDLVIGGEVYWDLHTGKKLSLGRGLPYLIETRFGWTLCGSTSQDSTDSVACQLSSTDALLDSTLQRFWEIETIPKQSVHSTTEKACEEFYAATTSRDPAGRYVVRLPRADNPEILYQKVASALKTVPPAYYWSDSTTVIQWLRSSPGRWKTFVANRVSQIQAATPIDKWNHVAGADNPADDISRGLDPSDLLIKERWWTGPAWLKLSPEQWPAGALPAAEPPEFVQEIRKAPVVAMTSVQITFAEELFSRYSSFSKLRRTVAWCLRYLQTLRDRAITRRRDQTSLVAPRNPSAPSQPLNSDELHSADRIIVRLAQRESFPDEYSNLSAGVLVSKSSPLKWLKAYVDEFGLIRVGGRLSNLTPGRPSDFSSSLGLSHQPTPPPVASVVPVLCHAG